MTKVTGWILATSLVVYLGGDPARCWLIYDRSHADELWRFFSASFVHYDLHHLLMNLLAFAVLGSVLENKRSGRELIFLVSITIIATPLCLHFVLPEYSTFAGISCVNYAILGYLIIMGLRRNLLGALAVLSLVICYQMVVILERLQGLSQQQPVWQLHTLALILGAFSALSFKLGPLAKRSQEPAGG